jgi:hypothetical protein
MAIVKKLGAPYTITTTNNSDTITLATTSPLGVIIAGNLTVIGNTAQVESNVTSITDNFVTLNAGETGHGVSLLGTTSGIIIDRGLYANVKLQWQEGANVWQVSDNTGINFVNIATSSTTIANLQADPNPTLGGNLLTNGYHIEFDYTNIIPSATANVATATQIYAAAPGSAGSGLYVTNSSTANQELVTKSKAIVYSLIL